MTQTAAHSTLLRRILVPYALPGFAIALPTIPVYIALPSLYGIDQGLGLAAVGAVLLIARAFDTVTDPIIGALSDRSSIGRMRRKPWIAVGSVIAGIGLWNVLAPDPGDGLAYLLFWSIVLYTGWTMVAVPYLAWGAELTENYRDRARVTSWREGAGLLGIIGASALSAAIVNAGGTNGMALQAVVLATVTVGAIFLTAALAFVPDDAAPSGMEQPLSEMRRGLHRLFKNRLFLRLLTAWFMNGLANGIPAALFMVYLEFGLGATASESTVLILIYFAAAVAGIPLWLWLTRRFDKHRIWCGAMAMASLAFLCVPLLPDGAILGFAAICLLTGAAFGADLALPPAIQADVADYDRLRTGYRREGLIFAFWGMGTKLALAGSAGIALPGVVWLGFDPEAPTASGLTALVAVYAVLPVAIKLLTTAFMWGFPLGAVRHGTVQRRLAALSRHSTRRMPPCGSAYSPCS
ncbi:MFS transporter [Rhodospirillaceae bacterium KN72]|uniref:MFS transporter n=1 Tax=Pacificispira spongiicola TaxID=2729598 RepID=A0A7Y0DXF3_9PROT|nr:MFS transporter [Pacificispira spongiicola]NMM43361.1 MFS transporter [Pacificispira spongiicola]